MRIIVLILLLSLASKSWGAIALLSHQLCNGGSCTTAAISTTNATLITIAFSQFFNQTRTLTDSAGNTWSNLTTYNQGNQAITIFYVNNPNTSASHTFFCDDAFEAGLVCMVAAWSGTGAAAPVSTNGNTAASGTTIQPGSVAPTLDGSLIFTGAMSNGAATWALDNGFTVLDTQQFSGGGADGYLIQTTAASINPTWTFDNSTNRAATIAVFSPPPPPIRLLTTSPGSGRVTSSPGTGVINFK